MRARREPRPRIPAACLRLALRAQETLVLGSQAGEELGAARKRRHPRAEGLNRRTDRRIRWTRTCFSRVTSRATTLRADGTMCRSLSNWKRHRAALRCASCSLARSQRATQQVQSGLAFECRRSRPRSRMPSGTARTIKERPSRCRRKLRWSADRVSCAGRLHLARAYVASLTESSPAIGALHGLPRPPDQEARQCPRRG